MYLAKFLSDFGGFAVTFIFTRSPNSTLVLLPKCKGIFRPYDKLALESIQAARMRSEDVVEMVTGCSVEEITRLRDIEMFDDQSKRGTFVCDSASLYRALCFYRLRFRMCLA